MTDEFISVDPGDDAPNSAFTSDFHHSISREAFHRHTQTSLAIEYWLGKRYFYYILAQHIIRMKSHGTIHTLDAQLEGMVRGYPYGKTVDELRARGLTRARLEHARSEDSYETLMATIGYVVLRDVPSEMKDLAAILRRLGPTATSVSSQASSVTSSAAPKTVVIDTVEATDKNAIYSSALKEYADKTRAAMPQYTSRTRDAQPPIHTSILTFRGQSFEGQAHRKQEAKHLASKKACEHFRVLAV